MAALSIMGENELENSPLPQSSSWVFLGSITLGFKIPQGCDGSEKLNYSFFLGTNINQTGMPST